MKFRSFIIVLLAVLMAFAFASCKQEPKEEPKPTPKPYSGDFYQIEVTEGVDKDYYNRDKIKLVWNVNVKEGDTISLKYRSERDVYQWDIRNGDHKWVYQTDKNGFVDPVLGDDGWYTMTYTIGKTITGASGASSALGIYFRGNFVTTDIFEIKEIMLNDEELEVVPETITSAAQLNDPAEEFDWSVKNYAVLFATGTPGEVDETPIAEKVVAGGKVTGAPIAKENYSLTIYTDEAHTTVFDPETPITEEKIFYYEYVGDPRTVTYVLNNGSENVSVDVHYNDLLTPPADPELEGKAFKAWYKDQELTTKWDFLTEHIEDNLTLYAGYGEPIEVTFDAQNGEAEHTKVTVAKGNPVAMPTEAPTNGSKMFLGWFTEAECTTAYNFAAPVEADITLYAGWVNATDVTLNLNYEGAPAATSFKAPLDVALSAEDENLVVNSIRPGYIFEGWCTDAACTTAYDYTTVVTGPFTLYAKWTNGTVYRLVSTKYTSADGNSDDKFVIKWGDTKVKPGDVVALSFRTTEAFTQYSLRGEKKWFHEKSESSAYPLFWSSIETGADGWTTVFYQFPGTAAATQEPISYGEDGTWFMLYFRNQKMIPGAIMEVKGISLNGKELAVTADNIQSYASPTFEADIDIVEWTAKTVTFNVNGGSAIDPVEVEFGKAINMPADPTKESKVFAGWYTDVELTKEFDRGSAITADTTLYAKYGDGATVTFSGSDIAPVVVLKGAKVARPADPSKVENVFGGWYTDEGCTSEYDFDSAVEADITLYAKWTPSWTVTLNYNYGDTPETKNVYVAKGEVMAAPKAVARAGYFFDGWYDEAACTTAHDFSVAVTANATIYAKWNAPTKSYTLTATTENDRIQLRFIQSSVDFLQNYEAGDTFAYMVKFTPVEGSSAPSRFRVRGASNYGGTSDFSSGISVSEPDANGWISVTCVFPEDADFSETGILMDMRLSSGKIAVGDVAEIKGMSFNGQEIALASSSSCGPYEGCVPTFAENTL